MDPHLLIENHSLVNLAMHYKICRKCSRIRNLEPYSSSYQCDTCGSNEQYPNSFFDLNLLLMIDLMQDSYITATSLVPASKDEPIPAEQARLASVVVYFCTVKELMLHRFLSHLLDQFPLPVSFLEHWDKHYFTYSQRREKLLPALLGVNWEKLLTTLTAPNHDFPAMSAFLKKATDARDNLLHEGDHFDIDPNHARGCLENLFPLMEFYALLHNKYVHERRMDAIRRMAQSPAS